MGAGEELIPDAAVALVKREEGLRLKPYLCPAGFPTIGYGHVLPSLDHPPITREEAEALLRSDMAYAAHAVLRYCPVLATEDPRRYAAIISFTFNLGAGRLRASTLRRRINQRDWPEAEHELKRWHFIGAFPSEALYKRRCREADLFMLRVPG